jgi:hypothetical protein
LQRYGKDTGIEHRQHAHVPATGRVSADRRSAGWIIVSIDYRWELEGEIGAGATRWFFCIFGRAFAIDETGRYVI